MRVKLAKFEGYHATFLKKLWKWLRNYESASTDKDRCRLKTEINQWLEGKGLESPALFQQNFLMELEQYLGIDVRDHDFLDVRKGDGVAPGGSKVPLIFVLENLRSAFNVGSFFRLADTLGVERIILLGQTPGPENAKVIKTAMGAVKHVCYDRVVSVDDLSGKISVADYRFSAVETCDDSINYFALEPCPRVLFFGNEKEGVSSAVLTGVSEVIQVPVFGYKNSLNVAQCAAIVGSHLANGLRGQGVSG